MKLISDKSFERLNTQHKRKPTYKIKEMRKSHKTILDLSLEILKIENEWIISSENSTDTYSMQQIKDKYDCNLTCSELA